MADAPHPSASRVIDLYQRHADAFDRDRSRTQYGQALFDRFAAMLPAQGRVLDLGCGHGEPVAAHLIGLGHRVTGVDSTPDFIALCRERFPEQEWIVGDMRETQLGQRFDGVLAWDSFFHLAHDDQRAMFDVFEAHAAPGAPLMFNTGPGHGEAIGHWQGEPLYHASLSPEEYRELLDGAGFDIVEHAPDAQDAGGRTIWLARRRA
jgi:SAM-dependent methyltransferase